MWDCHYTYNDRALSSYPVILMKQFNERTINPACYILLLLKLFSCTLFSLIKMIHSTSFLNRTGDSDSTYSYCNNTQKINGFIAKLWGEWVMFAVGFRWLVSTYVCVLCCFYWIDNLMCNSCCSRCRSYVFAVHFPSCEFFAVVFLVCQRATWRKAV